MVIWLMFLALKTSAVWWPRWDPRSIGIDFTVSCRRLIISYGGYRFVFLVYLSWNSWNTLNLWASFFIQCLEHEGAKESGSLLEPGEKCRRKWRATTGFVSDLWIPQNCNFRRKTKIYHGSLVYCILFPIVNWTNNVNSGSRTRGWLIK